MLRLFEACAVPEAVDGGRQTRALCQCSDIARLFEETKKRRGYGVAGDCFQSCTKDFILGVPSGTLAELRLMQPVTSSTSSDAALERRTSRLSMRV